jgi:hypothetical protein
MKFSDSTQVTELYDEPSSKLSQQLLTQEIQGFDYAVLTSEVQILSKVKPLNLKV